MGGQSYFEQEGGVLLSKIGGAILRWAELYRALELNLVEQKVQSIVMQKRAEPYHSKGAESCCAGEVELVLSV